MPSTVFDLLDREWDRLARDERSAAALRAWATDEPVLDAFGDLGELSGFTRSAPSPEADRVLAALARRAPGDDLAARVLLQLLLPGCRAAARRLATEHDDPDERAAVVVAAAYGRIRTYPAERRPAAIAPNVILDTTKWARRALRSPSHTSDQTPIDELHEVACVDAPHAADELLAVLDEAVSRGIVDRDDAQVVALTRIAGEPIARLAAERRCHPGSLRRRREQAERALATVA